MKRWKGHKEEPPQAGAVPQRRLGELKALYPAASRCRDAVAELSKARASPLLSGIVTKLVQMPQAARLLSNCISAMRTMAGDESNEFAMTEDEVEALQEADDLRSDGKITVETEGTIIGLLCPEERLLLVEAMLPAFRRARTRKTTGEPNGEKDSGSLE